MTTLGTLMVRLRRARGLSQKKLADLSGLTQLTITQLETDPDRTAQQSTLMAIAKGFNSSEFPLSGKDLEDFVNISGLTALLWNSGTFFEQPGQQPLSPQAAFYAQLSEPEAAIVRRALQLAQEIGPDTARKMLDTVAVLASTARVTAPSPTSLTRPSPKPRPARSRYTPRPWNAPTVPPKKPSPNTK